MMLRICSRASRAWSSATFMMPLLIDSIFRSICSAVTPRSVPATLKSMSPRWSSSPRMSDSTAKRLPSLIRPIAIPATCALTGTPASISARLPPQTEAIDEEPLDSVISETTRIDVQDLAAHDLRLQVEEDLLHRVGVERAVRRCSLGRQLLEGALADFDQAVVARLLLLHGKGGAEVLLGKLAHARDQRLVLRRGLPVPGRLAGLFGQRMDGLERGLHLLVAESHRAEHHVLGQLERLGFHHQHALLGPGDDQVELRPLQLAHRRVDDVLPVDVTDPARADP